MYGRQGVLVSLACTALLAGTARPATAQTRPAAGLQAAAGAALETCARAAAAGQEGEAKAAAAEAERLYGEWIAARPRDPDPLVGRARSLVQCRLPFASFMGKGRLSGESAELAQQALALDSTHWNARYLLALNYYHTPRFVGRTGDAIREFERLIAQQGNRTDPTELAGPYLYLGDLYRRAGREADARAIWQRGAALFPQDARLRSRLAGEGRETGNGDDAPANDPADAGEDAKVTGRGELPADADTAPEAALPGGDGRPAESGEDTASSPVYSLAGVTVRARRLGPDLARSGTTLQRLDVLTSPGASADVLRALQSLPGATAASEGSDLYVRGGDPAETPVFVDGGRLLYAGKFETLHGGIFGILDPSVLKEAYFSSGGFSARYGNALSGVLDVRTEGRPATRTGRVGLNLASLGATGRTPLATGVGGWASATASETSLLMRMGGQGDEFATAPRSVETTLGVVAEPRPNTELRAVAMAEWDEVGRWAEAAGYEGIFQGRGGNAHALLSGQTTRDDGLGFLRATAAISRRTSGFGFGVLDRTRTGRSLTLRADAEQATGSFARVRTGIEAVWLDAREEGLVPTTEQIAPGAPSTHVDSATEAEHLGGYVEGEIPVSSRLTVVAGARADRLPGEDGWTMDPRYALVYSASDWVWRLSGGVFHQGRWRSHYRLPDGGSPAGVPRRAQHLALGVERRGDPAVRLEGYLKEYGRYVPGGEGPPITGGRTVGADAILRWMQSDPLSGWITYSVLRGRVHLADGATVPSATDVTHTLTGVGKLALGSGWELSGTARYATGRPYTPVLGVQPPTTDAPPALLYGPVHGMRLPAFVRLDGRLTRFLPLGDRFLVGYLEVLNVLDRPNLTGYTYDSEYRERRPVESFFAQRTAMLGVELQF